MRASSGKWCHLPLCCASAPGADSTSSAAAIITAHGLNQLAPAAPIRLCAPEGAWLDIFAARVTPLVILVVGNGYPAPEPPQRSQHAALRPVSRRRLFNPEDQFPRKSLNYRRLAALSASEMGQLAASRRRPSISTRPRPSSPLSPPSDRPKCWPEAPGKDSVGGRGKPLGRGKRPFASPLDFQEASERCQGFVLGCLGGGQGGRCLRRTSHPTSTTGRSRPRQWVAL